MGKDGRTTYSTLYGRNSAKAVLEIGEQVMTKLLRGRKSQSKLSLKEGWVFATWVGIDAKTIEHVVVIGEGEAAIRVRTVHRRPASDNWNVDAVKAMRASLRVPNPQNLRQVTVKPERVTKKIEVEGDGSEIQEQVRRFQEFKFREFKLTKGILEKFGLSDNCKGCEGAASQTGARRHTGDCQQRLEQLIHDDEVLRVRLDLCHVRLNRDGECEKNTNFQKN